MCRSAVIILLAAAACCAAQTDEQKRFAELYGARAKAVAATADKRDDAELARQLIEDARKPSAEPAFAAYLLRRAYDLTAWDAAGWPVAKEAATFLAQLRPDQTDAAEHLLLDILKREFDHLAAGRNTQPSAEAKAAGNAYVRRAMEVATGRARWPGKLDEAAGYYRSAAAVAQRIGAEADAAEIADRLRDIAERQAAAKRAEQLRTSLRKTPDDADAAAELVRTLLVLNQTDEACRYIAALKDESLARVAALAARHPLSLSAAGARTLGDWYTAAAGQSAGRTFRRTLLDRARLCYKRGEQAADDDGQRAAFRRSGEQTEAAIAALPPAGVPAEAPPAGALLDLLAATDAASDGLEGDWRKEGNALVSSPAGVCRLRLPRKPPPEYDLYVDFTRTGGDGPVVLIVSRAQNPFQWCMGVEGFCGIETMRGKSAADAGNPLRVPFPIVQNRRYSVVLQVRRSAVTAFIDDRLLARTERIYELSGGQRWPVGRDAPGIGTDGAGAVFHSIRIAELGAEGGPLGPARSIDLLNLIDPARDTLNGAWRLADGRLAPSVGMHQCVRVPYYPPDEYDLRARFTPARTGAAVTLIAPRGDRTTAAFTVDTAGRCDFEIGRRGVAPATRAVNDTPDLAPGRPHECVLRVRRNSITALIDGRRVAMLGGERDSTGVPAHWSVGDRILGLGSDGQPSVFEKLELIEISGDGRPATAK